MLQNQGCDFKIRTLLACLIWVRVLPGKSARLALTHLAQCSPWRAICALSTGVLCLHGLVSGCTVDVVPLYGTRLLCTNDLGGHSANIFSARVPSLSVLVTVGCGEKTGIQRVWFCCKKPVSFIPCTPSTATLSVSCSFVMQLTFPACLL